MSSTSREKEQLSNCSEISRDHSMILGVSKIMGDARAALGNVWQEKLLVFADSMCVCDGAPPDNCASRACLAK
ncbi:unnamed protein product [Lampetra planeri]